MSEPYIGEIRQVGFTFAPPNWAFCDGSLLFIADNTALFDLIGTTYGGDGQTTFGLPDLRGRIPLHAGFHINGNNYSLGQQGGAESVTLTPFENAVHSHPLSASSAAAAAPAPSPSAVPAAASTPVYSAVAPYTVMTATGAAGGGHPHDNLMPFGCVNFIISLFGVFPSQN